MQRPKLNKPYLFVRVTEDRIEHAEFIRYEDGSSSYVLDGNEGGVEEDPDAWKLVTAWLSENGYMESNEAKAVGLIPYDWQPEATILQPLK